MAENDGQNAADGGQGAPQNLGVLAQYVKDLSFENPGAPQSLRSRSSAPAINITINVATGQPSNNEVEVELKIEAEAKVEDRVLFAVDLTYGGMFRLTNIPVEAVQPVLMIECPRLLFPFARQILAEATRNGGFPPLLIDPVDFVALYRQRLAGMQPRAPDQLA
ncbi:MAG: protein-export chaperone SecB [Bauldia sp.]|nr:protein-export chaperone SecB [Bauldia sp.]